MEIFWDAYLGTYILESAYHANDDHKHYQHASCHLPRAKILFNKLDFTEYETKLHRPLKNIRKYTNNILQRDLIFLEWIPLLIWHVP